MPIHSTLLLAVEFTPHSADTFPHSLSFVFCPSLSHSRSLPHFPTSLTVSLSPPLSLSSCVHRRLTLVCLLHSQFTTCLSVSYSAHLCLTLPHAVTLHTPVSLSHSPMLSHMVSFSHSVHLSLTHHSLSHNISLCALQTQSCPCCLKGSHTLTLSTCVSLCLKMFHSARQFYCLTLPLARSHGLVLDAVHLCITGPSVFMMSHFVPLYLTLCTPVLLFHSSLYWCT